MGRKHVAGFGLFMGFDANNKNTKYQQPRPLRLYNQVPCDSNEEWPQNTSNWCIYVKKKNIWKFINNEVQRGFNTVAGKNKWNETEFYRSFFSTWWLMPPGWQCQVTLNNHGAVYSADDRMNTSDLLYKYPEITSMWKRMQKNCSMPFFSYQLFWICAL